MALSNNPTNNQLVKEVKRLDAEKQDTLTAGNNIDITNNVVSAKDVVTTNTDQTITGEKTITDTDISFKNSNASGNASWQLEEDVYGQLAVSRTYNNVKSKMMEFNGNSIKPVGNNGNLGSASQKWLDIYLSGKLKDGTNEIAVADIANKTDILLKPLTLSTTTMTDEQIAMLRVYNCILTNDLTLGNTSLKAGTILTVPFEYSNSLRGMAIYNNKIMTYYINLTTKVIGDGAQDIVISNVANIQTGKVTIDNYTITKDSFGQLQIGNNNATSMQFDGSTVRAQNLVPIGNNSKDLGSSSQKWKDLHLAGNLTDGTNSISIANIQPKLTPGTNITIDENNVISATGGGTATDVKVDGTSITSNNEADIQTINGDYNASTNKLATEADLPTVPSNIESTTNKVTSISSSSTDTQYPSAKCVYDAIQDVAEVAEGKTANYVISDATTGTNVVNSSFNSTQDTVDITITSNKITDVQGNDINLSDLKIGDIVSVTETSVPDRWVGSITSSTVTFYKLETKLDIDANPTSGSSNPVSSGGVYSSTVADITYDSANAKIQKTKNGSTTDLVTFGANAFTNTTIPNTISATSNNTQISIALKNGNTLLSTTTISKASTTKVGAMPPLNSASVSTQTQSTKFMREDGTWAAPSYTGTTSSVTENSTSALTSGGAYTNLVRDVVYDNNAKQLKVTKNNSTTGISVLTTSSGLPYTTTAPTSANTDGLKIVVLSSEPANRYSGYIYIITE